MVDIVCFAPFYLFGNGTLIMIDSYQVQHFVGKEKCPNFFDKFAKVKTFILIEFSNVEQNYIIKIEDLHHLRGKQFSFAN